MNTLTLIAAALAAALITSGCSEAQVPVAQPATPAPAVAVDEPASPVATGSLPPLEVSEEAEGSCNIEAVGEHTGPALDALVRVQGVSSVSGWRSLQTLDGSEAAAWLRAVDANGSVALQVSLPATEDRPDVAEVAGRDSALRSGFRDVAVVGLAPGNYTLEVVFDAGSGWIRCANSRELAVE